MALVEPIFKPLMGTRILVLLCLCSCSFPLSGQNLPWENLKDECNCGFAPIPEKIQALLPDVMDSCRTIRKTNSDNFISDLHWTINEDSVQIGIIESHGGMLSGTIYINEFQIDLDSDEIKRIFSREKYVNTKDSDLVNHQKSNKPILDLIYCRMVQRRRSTIDKSVIVQPDTISQLNKGNGIVARYSMFKDEFPIFIRAYVEGTLEKSITYWSPVHWIMYDSIPNSDIAFEIELLDNKIRSITYSKERFEMSTYVFSRGERLKYISCPYKRMRRVNVRSKKPKSKDPELLVQQFPPFECPGWDDLIIR